MVISLFTGGLYDGVQQNVGTGFTVLPGGVFDFNVAAAADAGNKYHRRWTHLIHITGIMTGPADHMQAGITQIISNVQDALYQLFVKRRMLDPPGFFYFDRAAPASRNIFKVLADHFPGL